MKKIILVSLTSLTATLSLSACGAWDWTTNKSKEWGSSLPVSNSSERCADQWICGSKNNTGSSSYQNSSYATPIAAPSAAISSTPQSPAAYAAPVAPQGYYQAPQAMPGQPQSYQQGYPSPGQVQGSNQIQNGNQLQVAYANNPATPAMAATAYQSQAVQAASSQYAGASLNANANPTAEAAQAPAANVPVTYLQPIAPQNYAAAPQGFTASQGNYTAEQLQQMQMATAQASMQAPQMAAMPPMPGAEQMPPSMPGIPANPYDEASQDPRLSSQEANPDWKDKIPPEQSQAAQQFEASQKPF